MSNNLNKNDHLLPSSFEEREALEKTRPKLAKKQDLFVILAIALLAIGIWIFAQIRGRGQALYAEIYYFNELIDTIELTPGDVRQFVYDEHPEITIQVNVNGSIEFLESDCPDQICVHAGSVHTAEAFVACVPNGFVLSVHAHEDSIDEEVDIVN